MKQNNSHRSLLMKGLYQYCNYMSLSFACFTPLSVLNLCKVCQFYKICNFCLIKCMTRRNKQWYVAFSTHRSLLMIGLILAVSLSIHHLKNHFLGYFLQWTQSNDADNSYKYLQRKLWKSQIYDWQVSLKLLSKLKKLEKYYKYDDNHDI